MEFDILRNKFLILILQDLLEKSDAKTTIERKCEQPELASDFLQMIVIGIDLLLVYEFHTNYGKTEKTRNFNKWKYSKKYFIENWKNKIFSYLNFEKKDIFIMGFRNGYVKLNAFLGKELTLE